MFELEITESAESDLDQITDYLSIDADAEVVRVLRFFHKSENYANKL
jgi:plasmid stabilization system protein ParE